MHHEHGIPVAIGDAAPCTVVNELAILPGLVTAAALVDVAEREVRVQREASLIG
jgi:hypothetical protein